MELLIIFYTFLILWQVLFPKSVLNILINSYFKLLYRVFIILHHVRLKQMVEILKKKYLRIFRMQKNLLIIWKVWGISLKKSGSFFMNIWSYEKQYVVSFTISWIGLKMERLWTSLYNFKCERRTYHQQCCQF